MHHLQVPSWVSLDSIPTTCRPLHCMSLTTSTPQLFLLSDQSYPLFSPASPPEMSVNILMQQGPFLTSSCISLAHSLMDREPQLPGPAVSRRNLRVTAFSSKLNNPLILSPTGLSKAVILHLFFLSLCFHPDVSETYYLLRSPRACAPGLISLH